MNEGKFDQGREIPTFYINADNIPQAHFRATKKVLEDGMQIRTEYDRKNASGEFIDPASRDATVMVHITNPFNQPRYPCVSCVERGTYIAEILGVKDQRVIPFAELKDQLMRGQKLESTLWPYSYHQRLFSHPSGDEEVNQIDYALGKLAKDPITRRAVATTRLPQIDTRIKEDLPCLGEVHLRCTQDNGDLFLNMTTYWRSRDLFKAWHDNVIGLTFMQQVLAQELGKMTRREVKVGGYTDVSTSLHVYGQDIVSGGSAGMTAGQYLALGEDAVVKRATTSDFARDNVVIPELEELIAPNKIQEWSFDNNQVRLIRELIEGLNSGRLIA